MKHTITHALALLIVFSASVSSAADSASVETTCHVVAEEETLYRLSYQAGQQQNVTIQLFDNNDFIVYQEHVNDDAFSKKFDLKNLPYGEYRLVVKSDGYFFSEKIVLGDLSSFAFDFDHEIATKKVTLIGSKVKGRSMMLYILDDDRNVVYKESFDDHTQVNKKFNLQSLKSEKATFLLYHDDQLIKEKEFVF